VNGSDPLSSSADPTRHTRELLDLLDEVDQQGNVSQRSLAERIGIAVGLANALVRRAVRKGFIKVSQAPVRRYAYYLTPEGFAEKSRLVAEYLSFSLSFFRRARSEYCEIFEHCANRGWTRVVLAGAGELAEIALIAAHECNITVVGVLDAQTNRNRVAGVPVLRTLNEASAYDVAVVSEAKRPFECFEALAAQISPEQILAPALLRLQRKTKPQPREAQP
jgi:DNA-binding MarR family transcriptional regulator